MSCGRERNQRPGSDLSPATAQLAGQVRHVRPECFTFVIHQAGVVINRWKTPLDVPFVNNNLCGVL